MQMTLPLPCIGLWWTSCGLFVISFDPTH